MCTSGCIATWSRPTLALKDEDPGSRRGLKADVFKKNLQTLWPSRGFGRWRVVSNTTLRLSGGVYGILAQRWAPVGPTAAPKTFSSLLALEGIGVTLKEARKHDLTNVVHSLRDHRVLPLSVLATRIVSSISLFSCWRDSVLMDASAKNDLLCDVRILHAWCIFSNQQIWIPFMRTYNWTALRAGIGPRVPAGGDIKI